MFSPIEKGTPRVPFGGKERGGFGGRSSNKLSSHSRFSLQSQYGCVCANLSSARTHCRSKYFPSSESPIYTAGFRILHPTNASLASHSAHIARNDSFKCLSSTSMNMEKKMNAVITTILSFILYSRYNPARLYIIGIRMPQETTLNVCLLITQATLRLIDVRFGYCTIEIGLSMKL